ncbi:hypothetical protein Ctob_001323 [Chrysochromulina tobinii]|jgi:hypothetical protein|uniref:At4g15545-like C-terminal domain-containing protein n=1 Tax=Chrysochromulina tobinii TaxID=1460289 RepID=A0A0M0JM50_9EUKA|nr:hypothetical protein Ctob_001323 [Chrysochromulina tobinii]|eukprot:KOO27654.1 hypothetical protein Ctob_001323 [Chrysochromulina sp. CCMP291]
MMASGPDEALRQGLRMIETAYDEKARQQEHELQQLRAYGKDRQQQVALLERRVAELEAQLSESESRVRVLSDEKSSLQQDLKATQRDLSKLDSFKRSILQSIKDEDLPGSGAAAAAAAAGGFLFSAAGGCSGGVADFTPGGALGPRSSFLGGLGPSSPCNAPYSSRAQPPMSASVGAPPPAAHSVAATPAPPESAAARMDGKDFFRQARLRLTYEQFNQFLANIKRLNDHAQSREETIRMAQEIFGGENEDLFSSFKALLSKHGLS